MSRRYIHSKFVPSTESLHQQFLPCSEAKGQKVYSEDDAASASIPSLVHSGMRSEPAGEDERAKRAKSQFGCSTIHLNPKGSIKNKSISNQKIQRTIRDQESAPKSLTSILATYKFEIDARLGICTKVAFLLPN